MSDNDQQHEVRASAKCICEIWTTAKGSPQWRVRVTDEANDELCDEVIGRAVRAHNQTGRLLKDGDALFTGQAPTGRAAGHAAPAAYVRDSVPTTLVEAGT